MRRRDIVGLVAVAAAILPWAGTAQTTKVYRVGLLTGGSPISNTSADGSALIRNLAQRGYAFGRNMSFVSRGAMGLAGWLSRSFIDHPSAIGRRRVTQGQPRLLDRLAPLYGS